MVPGTFFPGLSCQQAVSVSLTFYAFTSVDLFGFKIVEFAASSLSWVYMLECENRAGSERCLELKNEWFIPGLVSEFSELLVRVYIIRNLKGTCF